MRRTAIAIGALFWISNLVTLVGSAVAGTVPSSAGALAGLYPEVGRVTLGTLIAQINEAAIIGYAVLLYPVLRREAEGLALGYAAFKVVEGVLLLAGAAALLALLQVGPTQSGNSAFQASANVSLAQQFWAGRLATFAYLVATPILNYVLFRSRMVPPWISLLGLAGCALLATGLALGVGDPTRGFQPGQLLVIPIIVWELTFASWLILRGFSPAASLTSPSPSMRGPERSGQHAL